MTHWHNEICPFAAEWTRTLMAEGILPAGTVDERSIADLTPADVEGPGQRHFFGGVSGWGVALQMAGWPAERSCWSGSAPCQSYSTAGKRKGTDDPRDLWPTFFNLIRECRPGVVFGEQVAPASVVGPANPPRPHALAKAGTAAASPAQLVWLDRVCRDMEGAGYAVGACVLGAFSAGAPHLRQRLFWVATLGGSVLLAHAGGQRRERGSGGRDLAVGDALGYGLGRDAGAAPCQEAGGHRRRQVDGVGGVGAGGTGTTGGAVGPLGDTDGPREGAVGGVRSGSTPQRPGGPGPWADHDLVYCRDDKYRRVEPGTFPLAPGIPRGVGPLLAELERLGVDAKTAKRLGRVAGGILAGARRNRVGRLKAYGNAVVPVVAAEFVRAFLADEAAQPPGEK